MISRLITKAISNLIERPIGPCKVCKAVLRRYYLKHARLMKHKPDVHITCAS